MDGEGKPSHEGEDILKTDVNVASLKRGTWMRNVSCQTLG
jgi:hypothetical protein